MVDVNTQNKTISVNVSSSGVSSNVNASSDTTMYYSNKAREWAISNRIVDGVDYSSKYYANISKTNANSAKNYSEISENVLTEVQNSGNVAIENINTDKELALSEIEAIKIDAVNTANEASSTINTNKTAAINEINSTKTSAVSSVNSTKNTAISEINTTKTNAVNAVNTSKKEALDSIADSGVNNLANKDLSNLSTAGQEKFDEKVNVDDMVEINIGLTLGLFDTILKDHVLTYAESKGLALQGTYVYKEAVSGSRYGYPDFYTKCLEERNTATDTEVTLGDSTITMYVASNGHQYYDIADKNIVDTFFNTMGSAWFYGVDTENERIFLPRNNYFAINGVEETLPVDVYGSGKTLGLTNGAQNVGLNFGMFYKGTLGTATTTYNKAVGEAGSNNPPSETFKAVGVVTDPSTSGLTGSVDTSNILKLDDTKYLYICVGNTESEEALTNVTEITTSENDTLPWGYHFYSGELLEAPVGYIESLGQWNDGSGLYEQFFSKAVNKLGEAFASGYIKEVTEEYDDYDLVINQTDMTFRLPLLDGSESIPTGKYDNFTLGASGNAYEAPANGYFYVEKVSGGSSTYITVKNNSNGLTKTVGLTSSGGVGRITMFALKGETIKIHYTASGASVFRFHYAQGNGSLYFKVANAVQNLELLNAGEVLEAVNNVVPNNRTVWDGQWVYPPKSSTYTSWNTAGTKTIDLSGILPNDGYNYECLFNVSFYANGTSVQLYIGTDLCPLDTSTPNWVYEQGAGKGNSGTIILAVGNGRQVQVNASAAPSGGTFHFCVMGYRRLGTNT